MVKNTKLSETATLQFRAEVFDLLNHPSFGQPGRIVGTPGFGRVTNTRFPTGDSGSSRQLQFAVKLMFKQRGGTDFMSREGRIMMPS